MSISQPTNDQEGDRFVLILIGGGIVLIILSVIFAMSVATLPDWAETIFSVIVGGGIVKLADVLSALVALSAARQTIKQTKELTEQLTGGATDQASKNGGNNA